MFSKVFLAMTASEMNNASAKRTAYMALHFSPYGTGLTNLPQALPENSILLLDDSMQIQHHDPTLIAQQLKELVNKFSVSALLLDFQRGTSDAGKAIVSHILQALPCTVAVTEAYAREFHCPVFLSPTPVNQAPADHLSAWLKQGVYLEIAPEAAQFSVTETSVTTSALPTGNNLPLSDERLHCHYNVEVGSGKVIFTLERTKEDLSALAQEAYQLGALGVVGLYQELK